MDFMQKKKTTNNAVYLENSIHINEYKGYKWEARLPGRDKVLNLIE